MAWHAGKKFPFSNMQAYSIVLLSWAPPPRACNPWAVATSSCLWKFVRVPFNKHRPFEGAVVVW